MFDAPTLNGELGRNLDLRWRPHIPYIVEVANLYIAGLGSEAALEIKEALFDAAEAAAKVLDFRAEGFLEAMISRCEYLDSADVLASEARRIQAPPPPSGPAPPPLPPRPLRQPQDYRAEFDKLTRLRTERSRARGESLAVAALQANGWFRWEKSGPNQPGYGGILVSSPTAFRPEGTDFARWVTLNAAEPGMRSTMNCWEAVLFTAYRAGLIDLGWLRILHDQAAGTYERQYKDKAPDAAERYFQKLINKLGFKESVPYKPEAGLYPRKGDLLFWGFDHVAVSLGRQWDLRRGEEDSHTEDPHTADRMMSLWHHNGARFARLSVGDIDSGYTRNKLRFTPCPF
jgi:hypothetical protein